MGELDAKIDRHVRYQTDVIITNEQGDQDTFTIRCLPYKHMGKIWEIMRQMGKDKSLLTADKLPEEEQMKKILEVVDEKVVSTIVELVVETLKVSYPKEDKAKLELLGSSHFMEFFPAVMELNINVRKDVPK